MGRSLLLILSSLGGAAEGDLESFWAKKKEEVSFDWTSFGLFAGTVVGSVDGILLWWLNVCR